MTVEHLIDRCSRNDGEAWAELWQLVESVALGPLLRFLGSWRIDVTLADDVMQELYAYLQADHLRRLRAFRGATEAEFRAYLRKIALRFSGKILRRWQREQRQEVQALRQLPPADRSGPTERQIQGLFFEIEAAMSVQERRKLWTVSPVARHTRLVFNHGPVCRRPSARTLRQWRHELFHRFASQVV